MLRFLMFSYTLIAQTFLLITVSALIFLTAAILYFYGVFPTKDKPEIQIS